MANPGNPVALSALARIPVPAACSVTQHRAHATNFSPKLRNAKDVQAITLHATHGIEGPQAAFATAQRFAERLDRPVSAHYVIDSANVFCCVPDLLTAWHCGHHGNLLTIGLELCGSADQSRAQWLDAASVATLGLAARLCVTLCLRYGLPPAVVTPTGLRAGERGITTHAMVSQAWHESDHYDPGPGFPLGDFIVAVEAVLSAPLPPLAV